MSTSTMLRPTGSTAKPMKTTTTRTTGARKCTTASALRRNNVFLGQRLDAVGDRLKNAEGADAIGTEAILHAAQALALENCRERKESGKDSDNSDHAQHNACGGPPSGGQKSHDQSLSRMKI